MPRLPHSSARPIHHTATRARGREPVLPSAPCPAARRRGQPRWCPCARCHPGGVPALNPAPRRPVRPPVPRRIVSFRFRPPFGALASVSRLPRGTPYPRTLPSPAVPTSPASASSGWSTAPIALLYPNSMSPPSSGPACDWLSRSDPQRLATSGPCASPHLTRLLRSSTTKMFQISPLSCPPPSRRSQVRLPQGRMLSRQAARLPC